MGGERDAKVNRDNTMPAFISTLRLIDRNKEEIKVVLQASETNK